ncbi:Enhancing lycopene biosynthesis protein 2 [Gulbenkiania indica]|uniref:Enhancing lycopene biosynthesis protein 2 n=1 Tax=Gulbenkiania indica TaxID=375574 RepID=A0A0K6H1E1_9NEIS|nr:isoprenoid biosynthesis glyoxalase ElbB [Gulbenkiania indica]CUA84808.1 Enhancing lycopene biosynthesis protein 2 [Gulbenkiania indica]
MENTLPVALVLSGCGVYDGSEVSEAVGVIVALSQAGIPYTCYAPDRPQLHVINHAKASETDETRNILDEAARIARGNILPLAELDVSRHSAIVFPGGFGAAKNLTNFARAGSQAELADDVRAAVLPFIQAHKPVVALCAAPLVLGLAAREAGITGARITFGNPSEGKAMAEALVSWGQQHVETAVDAACVDEHHRFITAPAYMYGQATPAEVFASCQAAIRALGTMLGHTTTAA